MKTRVIRIGCSGWYYRHWKGVVYPAQLPSTRWFEHYRQTFDTVELNAPFYHWPQPATVRKWVRQATPGFQYSVKANRLITHLKRFNRTKGLVHKFSQIAHVVGEHMGCFLFQLPPSFRYTEERLRSILSQLEPRRRNAVEFRHASWWNEEAFAAFREAGVTFCSVNAPQLPDELIGTAALYLRFHGATHWYRYDYSDAELETWAEKLRASPAKEIWAYFNNDFEGCAFRNAQTLKRLLASD